MDGNCSLSWKCLAFLVSHNQRKNFWPLKSWIVTHQRERSWETLQQTEASAITFAGISNVRGDWRSIERAALVELYVTSFSKNEPNESRVAEPKEFPAKREIRQVDQICIDYVQPVLWLKVYCPWWFASSCWRFQERQINCLNDGHSPREHDRIQRCYTWWNYVDHWMVIL